MVRIAGCLVHKRKNSRMNCGIFLANGMRMWYSDYGF